MLSPGRVWQGATRPETLLRMLSRTPPAFMVFIGPDVRRFACWCARDAGAAETGEVSHRVLHTAEKYADGKLPASVLAAEKRAAAELEKAAESVGLSRRQPSAALQLAAIWTGHEHPFTAAEAAAHYTALAALWQDGEHAEAALRMRQASALRYFVTDPSIPEVHRGYAVA